MTHGHYTPGCPRPPEQFAAFGAHAFVPEGEFATRRAEWDRRETEQLRPPDTGNEKPLLLAGMQGLDVPNDTSTSEQSMDLHHGVSNCHDGEPELSQAAADEFDVVDTDAMHRAARIVDKAIAEVVGNGETELRLDVTTFNHTVNAKGEDCWQNIGARRKVTWAELCRELEHPSAWQRKGEQPLISFAVRAGNSKKAGAAALSVGAVCGDYDAGTVSIDEAEARIRAAGVMACLYTTASHTLQRPRWRVVAPFSAAIPPGEYGEKVDALNGALGGILAPESWDVTRNYFSGQVEGVQYRFAPVAGEPLDALMVAGLDWDPIGKPEREHKPRETHSAPRADARQVADDRQLERAITLNTVTPLTLVELDCALAVLDLTPYEVWIDVGNALASLKGTEHEDAARELWIKHSMRSAAFRDGDEDRWDTFKPVDITHTTVFHLADVVDDGWRERAQAAWDARGGDDVITKLCAMPREQVLGAWLPLAVALPKAAASRVMDKVHDLTDRRINILKAELADARTARTTKQKESALKKHAAGRVLIEYQPDTKTKHADQVEQAMLDRAKPGELLVFGGVLAQVVTKPLPFTHAIDDAAAEHDTPPVPQIAPLSAAEAQRGAEDAVLFYETTESGPRKMGIPQQVVDLLVKKRDHVAPAVNGLLNHPVVLPNGSILSAPGLHGATRLFMAGPEVPNLGVYSKDEAQSALERLRDELLADFEFASILDQDVALAGLFTAIERRVLPQAPGLLVVASTQASGKTTLVRLLHLVLTGHDLPVSTLTLGDEAEVRKALTSLLMSSPALVCFDNVPDGLTLRSGALAAAMTSPVFSDRLLGHTQTVEVPTNTLFTATGNNLSLGADEATRWLIARLAPSNARPQERAFQHRDVPAWGRRVRAQVLRDVLGIVAGYAASGTRDDTLPGVRFEAWDRLVRQPLVWAGGSDMAEAFRRNETVSEELSAHRGLLELLRRIFGDNEFRAGHVATVLADGGEFDPLDAADRRCESFRVLPSDERHAVVVALREALGNLRVADLRSAHKIGFALKAKQDASVVVGDSQLTLCGRDNQGSRLFEVAVRPLRGSCGS